MRINLYRILTSDLFAPFLHRFVRAYCWSLRLKVENEKPWMDYLKNGGTVLLCAWHQQFFSALRHAQSYNVYNPSIMISQSRDGEIIAKFAKLSGWNPVRGSSSRGGKDALKQMIADLKKTKLAGHILDGPQGPLGVVKPGVIQLAHETDAVIVPLSVRAEKAWYFNSWDKFFIPKPFSRVSIRFGDMLEFDKVEDENSFEKQRKLLEKIIPPPLET